jgi:hypothetical protein
MARIQTYSNDVDVNDLDRLVGTDGTIGADLNKTKNFTLGDIKQYITPGVVYNDTTAELTLAELDALYSTAKVGFKAHCLDLSPQPKIYEKTSLGWCSYDVTIVT